MAAYKLQQNHSMSGLIHFDPDQRLFCHALQSPPPPSHDVPATGDLGLSDIWMAF
jgi:hypothetical protein